MNVVKVFITPEDDDTRENLQRAFENNVDFFTQRGIDSSEKLYEVLSWKYIPTKMQRRIVFTYSFRVDFVQQYIQGFTITGSSTDTLDDVLDSHSTQGLALLYAIPSKLKTGNALDYLGSFVDRLGYLGLWDSHRRGGYKDGKIHCASSNDRVVSIVSSKAIDNLYFLYVKVTELQRNGFDMLADVSGHTINDKIPYITEEVEKLFGNMATRVLDEDGDDELSSSSSSFILDVIKKSNGPSSSSSSSKPQIRVDLIWSSPFNNVISDGSDFVIYNNCYEVVDSMHFIPIRNPELCTIHLLIRDGVWKDSDSVSKNPFESLKKLKSANPPPDILFCGFETPCKLQDFLSWDSNQDDEEHRVFVKNNDVIFIGPVYMDAETPSDEEIKVYERTKTFYELRDHAKSLESETLRPVATILHVPKYDFKIGDSGERLVAIHRHMQCSKISVDASKNKLIVFCANKLDQKNLSFLSSSIVKQNEFGNPSFFYFDIVNLE